VNKEAFPNWTAIALSMENGVISSKFGAKDTNKGKKKQYYY
jgi:hypothetical protein